MYFFTDARRGQAKVEAQWKVGTKEKTFARCFVGIWGKGSAQGGDRYPLPQETQRGWHVDLEKDMQAQEPTPHTGN